MNKEFISKFLPENSPGFLFWKVSNLWQQQIKQALEPFNLTHVQFVVLTCVFYLQNQNVTVSLISKTAQINKMMVSDVIKTLLKKGHIVKKKNQKDGRSEIIEIVEQSKNLVQEVIPVVENLDIIFFGSLDENIDLKRLIEILNCPT